MTNYNSSLYISIKHTIRNRQFQLKTQLTVPTGITVLCGHSGAGKSTLLNIIAGIIVPDEGYIALNDTVLFDSKKNICIPTHQRNIGYVFQTSALFPHLNCLNNVVYGIPKTTSKQHRIDHAMALLKQMNADHVAHQKPATLSGGETQRVAIARALASTPKALLLDEPFSAMDDSLKTQLSKEINTSILALNIPIVYVTHHETKLTTSQIVTMTNGHVTSEIVE